MKRLVSVIVGGLLLLSFAACANSTTTRRLNSLYERVNAMQSSITELSKKLDRIEDRVDSMKTPPAAEMTVLLGRIEQLNADYVNLARQLAEVQRKTGLTPIEVVPATQK